MNRPRVSTHPGVQTPNSTFLLGTKELVTDLQSTALTYSHRVNLWLQSTLNLFTDHLLDVLPELREMIQDGIGSLVSAAS